MKIIYVTTESYIDHSYTIASELKKKIDLKVYIIAKEKSEEVNNFCTKLNAACVKRMRLSNPFNIFVDLRLLNQLRKEEYDIVWFNTLTVNQALFLKLFIKKFLINTHDAELHPEENSIYAIFARWLTFRFHKKNICLASKTQASIFEKRSGIKAKIFQLPFIDYYESAARNLVEKGSKPGSDSRVKFFFFGTILPYKGIETLLDAAGILEKEGVKYELNIYGKIKYNEKNIIERIEKLNYVHLQNEFTSYDKVYAVFAQNDMLILPYIHITQCGPLLIAYNQNIPSLCSNLPGFAEYVDDGKSGLLFGGTAVDLAKKMKMVMNKPSSIGEMKKYIAENIKSRFSMKALCAQYVGNFEYELKANSVKSLPLTKGE